MSKQVDCCPACGADALALHHEPDGDETGTWVVFWFGCERCGQSVTARYDAGEYWPVVDDDAD